MTHLVLDGVTVTLGGVDVARAVTVHVEDGEVVGLVGPNGSGKSSVLRAVYRLLRPRNGAILIDGQNVWTDMRARDSAQRTAVAAQEAPVDLDISVRELVALGRLPHQRQRSHAGDDDAVTRAMEQTGVLHCAHRLVGGLSGGERQRVLLARALAQQCRLLILDEPTNHLDIASQLHLLGLVRTLHTTTVVALHDLNLAAAYCDRVVVMHDGAVAAAGPPAHVLTPALIARVFGVHADCRNSERTGALQLEFTPLPPAP